MPAAHARRLLLLALTVLALTGMAGIATAASFHVRAQNCARAFDTAASSFAGTAAAESACSRPSSASSTARVVSGFCVATEEAGSGGAQLFRAVEDPEAADLANTGPYRPSPTGSEYKGFFETQARAERFAGSMNAQGFAYNTITSGVVPNDLMSELPFTDLVGNESGRAYLAPNESLSRIFGVQIH